jgi:hypothetical protein
LAEAVPGFGGGSSTPERRAFDIPDRNGLFRRASAVLAILAPRRCGPKPLKFRATPRPQFLAQG